MIDWLLVDAASVLRLSIHVKGRTAVVFRQKLLDLPVVDLCADTELEVFLRDGVPELEDVSISSSSIEEGNDIPCRPS